MSTLAVLAFVSPIFGLRLEVQPSLLELSPLVPEAVLSAPIDATDDASTEAPSPPVAPTTAEEATPSVLGLDAPAVESSVEAQDETPDETEAEGLPRPPEVADLDELAPISSPLNDVAAQMNRRARLARAHKRLGIATWAAMTGTVITGTLQYANQYGAFASRDRTRCSGRGDPFFGSDACIGVPLPHVITTVLAGSLYYTTFGISFAMPDPIGLDRGNSESARALRQHKRMRWAHFGGMALQAVLGSLVANPQLMGMDRTNDYRALQALATVHLLSGYATYGMLTYTGARMAF